MDNEKILNELVLKLKGHPKGSKVHLTDSIIRIVKDRNFNSDDAIEFILNSGFFKLELHDAISLTEEGFEYSINLS